MGVSVICVQVWVKASQSYRSHLGHTDAVILGTPLYSDCIHHLEKTILIKTLNVPATQAFYFYSICICCTWRIEKLHLTQFAYSLRTGRYLGEHNCPLNSLRIISLDIELHDLIFTMMDIMMNILHEIHKLYPSPQETPFISEATDFSKKNSFRFKRFKYRSKCFKRFKYRFI